MNSFVGTIAADMLVLSADALKTNATPATQTSFIQGDTISGNGLYCGTCGDAGKKANWPDGQNFCGECSEKLVPYVVGSLFLFLFSYYYDYINL